jgi:hypothetical protein
MDPLTLAITTILGKYAIDKGATLLKEAGKAAADAAGKLFQKVIDRLKADPAEAKNADRFEKDPQGYAKPIADAVADKVQADPKFAAELQALVEEFKKSGGQTIIAGGDVFTADNAFKVGSNVGGNVLRNEGGTVNIGPAHTTTTNRSGGTDVNASQVDINGDDIGRDKKTKQQ